MSDTIETVRIAAPKSPGGFIVINKTDLKPGDVIFGEKAKPGKASSDGPPTVEEIKASLPEASDDELLDMLDAEITGKNRTTAIEAIEAEISARQTKD